MLHDAGIGLHLFLCLPGWHPLESEERERQIIVRNDSQHRGFRDPKSGKWLVYHRPNFCTRTVSVSESKDEDGLEFHKPWPCLEPDLYDKLNYRDHYAISVHPYDGGYLGFLKVYEKRWDSFRVWLELVVSRNGFNWQRMTDRSPIIALGEPGEWDAWGQQPGHSLVEDKGGHWFYYDSRGTSHSCQVGEGRHGIGRAFIPLRKLMECYSVSDAGFIKTYPMLIDGKTIMVDADARPGEIRASIESFDGTVPEGYAKEDSEVISGMECIAAPIQFRGGSLDRFTGQPVRLVFHLTRGTRLSAIGVK